MKDDSNWQSLGTLTDAIACRLARGQAELKKDGGTAEQGRSTSAAAKCPPGRSARPQVKGAAIGHDRTIALAAGENTGGRGALVKPRGDTRLLAPSSLTASPDEVGADLDDMGRKVGPAGSVRGEQRTTGNVIDYRERPVLLAAWGAFDKPRHRALPTSYARTTSSAVRSKAKAKSSSDAPNRTATTPK